MIKPSMTLKGEGVLTLVVRRRSRVDTVRTSARARCTILCAACGRDRPGMRMCVSLGSRTPTPGSMPWCKVQRPLAFGSAYRPAHWA